MGRWDRSEALLNETFRPRKLLAQKDAQLAELRGDWLKAHEAFRLSQDALAGVNGRLTDLQNDWIRVHQAFRLSQEALAQKDAELAELREDWVKVHEAVRLSQETLSQKCAQLTDLGNHWTNVLAEKDTELARSREHWNEALRLSQEAVAQKDVHLAELADHWSKVLAEKDAELAQSREHWGEALRLSQEALAQRDTELAKLRAGPVVLGVDRTELSELRTRFPWAGVFGPLKSASTFVWVALSRLLNADKLVFNVADPQAPGVQLMHELDPIRMRDPQLQRRSVVCRMHVTASQYTLFHIRDLSIPAIVCSRDILDCLVSLREELVKQWSNREHMLVTRERGSHEVFMGTVPIQMIERFVRVEPDRQIDMVIELAALWYLRFYQSWRCAKERYPELIHICRFESLATKTEAAMKDLLAFLNHPVDDDAISIVVSALLQDRAEANFNIGISGRGRQIMSGAQIDRVISIARAVGAEDLIGGL
jgi:hypothetical protein